MGAAAEFRKNCDILGFGFAMDCLRADIHYNTEMFFWNAYCNRALKKIERDKKKEGITDTSDEVPFEEDKKKAKAEKAENVAGSEEKKADSQVKNDIICLGAFTDDDIKNNLDDATTVLSNINAREVKLTVAALLYIGCFITSESVYKLMDPVESDNDIEFVNAVTKALIEIPFNWGKNSPALEDVFGNLEDFRRIVEYEYGYKQLGFSAEIEYAVQVARKLVPELSDETPVVDVKVDPETEERVIINPLSFATDPNFQRTMENTGAITKAEINKLEKKFDGLLTKADGTVFNHQFNKINELYELVIYDQMMFRSYKIDPGHIFGLGIGLLVDDSFKSTHLVPVTEKEIVKKILTSDRPEISLTDEEWVKIKSNLMRDWRIYSNIDMSRGEELLPNMSKDDYMKFQYRLAILVTLPWGQNNRPILPRVRIRKFNNPDDFILASDDKVKLVSLGSFNQFIDPNFVIVVKGEKIVIRTGENTEWTTTFEDAAKFMNPQA